MPEDTPTTSNADTMEEKPSSSNAGSSEVDAMEDTKKLIGTGKRHLLMGDVVTAVAVFQEACGLLAEKYGDTADECGEAFFLCGKALLELARMENSVLGNALDGVPEEESGEDEKMVDSKIESADNLDEETRDQLRFQVYDAMAEKDKPEESEGAKEEESDSVCKNNDEEASLLLVKEAEEGSPQLDTKDETAQGASEEQCLQETKGERSSGASEDEEEEEGGEEDDDDHGTTDDKETEEEVGNLQLAWEMLEVAKVIYKRKEYKDEQLIAAQIHLKLGEVSAESGNYSQALEDFQECLSLQLKYLPPHSRLLAETHYQLGVTFGYTSQYSQALQHFSSSVQVIESRMAMLQGAIEKMEDNSCGAEERRELEELKQLLPDIREKVEDTIESQRTAGAASCAIYPTLGDSSSSAFPVDPDGTRSTAVSQVSTKLTEGILAKPAGDITHLVRKKSEKLPAP